MSITTLSKKTIQKTSNMDQKTINTKKKKLANASEISQKIKFESATVALLSIIVQNPKIFRIVDNKIRINSQEIDILQKINYCFEFLCHIPFTFEFDSCTKEFYFDFTHLQTEVHSILDFSL